MSDTIITIRDASVRFNLAMQQQMSLKDHVKRLLKKELRFQEFLQDRHLLSQLLGHGVARRLVAVVHLMAEGRLLPVKGHGDGVRLGLF